MNKELPCVQHGSLAEPLDRARLADVLRGNAMPGADFLAEFRRSTHCDAAQLFAAGSSGDLVRVEQLAHRIEGACKVVGAGALAGACCVLAAAAADHRRDALPPALDVFRDRLDALDGLLGELSAAKPVGPQLPCAGLVFLVVEDHDFQRSMIVQLLRQLGALEVHGFADGESALAAARLLQGPAILVVDLAMPQLNGMEVVRIVGQERLPLSVIMNSALAEDMLRWPLQTARSYGAAVLGAVSKPLTAAKLAPALAQYRHELALAQRRISPQS